MLAVQPTSITQRLCWPQLFTGPPLKSLSLSAALRKWESARARLNSHWHMLCLRRRAGKHLQGTIYRGHAACVWASCRLKSCPCLQSQQHSSGVCLKRRAMLAAGKAASVAACRVWQLSSGVRPAHSKLLPACWLCLAACGAAILEPDLCTTQARQLAPVTCAGATAMQLRPWCWRCPCRHPQ